MSYLVLARKYRPKSFETLVGQPHVVRALTNALTQQRLHHAYLFTGTRGVGKTTIARILAKSLNCETGITATPCGVCSACTEIDRGRFVDMLEVDAASNTQVDAMRDLLDNAQYAPTVGRFKVYIIDEVHMLSKSAFNAMLKTLEEPPAHVKFILATTDPQKVPVTVLSRCLQFNLRQMGSQTISEHLQYVLAQENIAYEPAALHLISRAAAGSMRDALSLTDQAIAYGNQTVNEADVRSMLGAIDQSYLYDIIQSLINNDGAALIEKALAMQARNIAFEAALNDLANMLHQIAMAQTVPDSLANDLPERTILLDLAATLSPETLQLYYQIALLGRRDIGLAPDEYAGFTMTLLRMLAFTPNDKVAVAVSERISDKVVTPAAANNSLAIGITSVEKILPASNARTPSEPTIAAETASHQIVDTNNAPNAPSFNGDWRNFVDTYLQKLGLGRALAQNCEMIAFDENSISLRVDEVNKHLISATYQDKLSAAINAQLGKKIKLIFEIGNSEAATINTPAKQIAVEKATIQSSAEDAILSDPFVQDLMQQFGATIIPNSIKPIN
ncbi:MAG: DNA polymerase III subunit gamma/tau [Bdellovibrio sp.]|nr:DNA polymerase III subunit gamma/tau [Methylotenera sp.]